MFGHFMTFEEATLASHNSSAKKTYEKPFVFCTLNDNKVIIEADSSSFYRIALFSKSNYSSSFELLSHNFKSPYVDDRPKTHPDKKERRKYKLIFFNSSLIPIFEVVKKVTIY
ncbi:MAG: hypothetical protein NZ529_10160 [Cytophagaceae bacterium]|nr:hypothetical protein [Cytophagaceae bacterium]MDW8457148.1 hypothetical protein [Cytophagaceae bacterium]